MATIELWATLNWALSWKSEKEDCWEDASIFQSCNEENDGEEENSVACYKWNSKKFSEWNRDE